MNKRGIKNVLLVLVLVAVGILMLFRRELFPCGSNITTIIIGVLYISLFPYALFLLLKSNNVEGRLFWIGLVTIALGILTVKKQQNFLTSDIEKNGGLAKPAIIYKKYANIKTPGTVHVNYSADGELKSAQFICGDENYKALSIGDTIMVVYSLRCSDWALPLDYFPTHEKLSQCKEGCLLKNGELLLSN
jgi:hypothetical protein